MIAPRLLALLFALHLVAIQASAATHCVNPTGTGGCFASIQSALDAAARNDTVTVAAGTYVENLVVPRSMTVVGEDQATTIIDGGGAGSVVTTLAKTTVAISNLTITGGIGTQLFLPATTRVGGGVLARGKLSLVDVTIAGNTADCGMGCGHGGGGVYAADRAGRLTLERCTISGNASYFGAGIHAVAGRTRIVDSTISDNHGTGVELINGSGKLEVYGSTISGNEDVGLRIAGSAKLANSTVSGNHGLSFGGGIDASYSQSALKLNYVTIVGNDSPCWGCGAGLRATKKTTMQNSVLADNTGPGPSPECSAFRSRGYNVVKGDCTPAFPSPHDRFNTDPLLGPLADNGGPTWTHALLPGSPAIDSADPAKPGHSAFSRCVNVDQRGHSRVGRCDAGAFEF